MINYFDIFFRINFNTIFDQENYQQFYNRTNSGIEIYLITIVGNIRNFRRARIARLLFNKKTSGLLIESSLVKFIISCIMLLSRLLDIGFLNFYASEPLTSKPSKTTVISYCNQLWMAGYGKLEVVGFYFGHFRGTGFYGY